MVTLNEYYNKVFTTYYMKFDSKGNFKEGKGILPYKVTKAVEKEIKKHIRKSRKNNMFVEVLYSNEHNNITRIYVISESKYNNIHIGL